MNRSRIHHVSLISLDENQIGFVEEERGYIVAFDFNEQIYWNGLGTGCKRLCEGDSCLGSLPSSFFCLLSFEIMRMCAEIFRHFTRICCKFF